MPVAILIAVKDLRERLRDRSAIIAVLLVPFLLAAILGATIPNVASNSNAKYNFGLFNDDHGPAALYFISEILEPLQRKGLVRLHPVSSISAGRELVRNHKVVATFVLPAGFSHAALSEAATRVQIIGDEYKQTGTFVARSIASSFANELNSVRLAVASARRRRASPGELARLGANATNLRKPVTVRNLSLPNKELDSKTHTAAGLAVFFLFFTVQFGFLSLLDERRQGTLTRMLVAPVPRRSILVGKLLTSIILGLFSMAVLAVTTTLFLGAHWGSLPGVALLVFACVLAATAMTALIASFAQTAEQAGNWQVISAALIGALGGAMFPVAQAGGTLATVSLFTPHAQFLRGLGEISHGGGISSALPMLGAILAFAAILGGVAMLRIRRLVGQ